MAYRIAGTYIAACSCAQLCPCPVDGTPLDPEGKGECRGSAVFGIREGDLDGTDLSGTAVAFFNYFPANITAGNWKVKIVVDDGASDEQAQAIERILSGQEGGPFGEFAPLIGEYAGMERGSVSVSDGSATVPEGSFSFEPHLGVDGTPTTTKNAMFGFAPEFQVGKSSGSLEILGTTIDLRYAESAEYEFSTEKMDVRGRA